MLGLLPAIEPPPGFETRVLDRLGIAGPAPARRARGDRRRWGRDRGRAAGAGTAGLSRRTLAAAALVLAVLGAAGGFGIRAATAHPAGSALSSAALLTASHQAVGKIFLYNDSPRWVYMSVSVGSAAAR